MKEKRLSKLFLLIPFLIFSCNTIKINDAQKRFILNDKGRNKFFLINYINKNRNLIGEVPTLIIHKKEGQEIIHSDQEVNYKLNLKRSDFIRIEILSIDKSIPLYGSAGKNGVLTICIMGNLIYN